jgi:hypothetical protein
MSVTVHTEQECSYLKRQRRHQKARLRDMSLAIPQFFLPDCLQYQASSTYLVRFSFNTVRTPSILHIFYSVYSYHSSEPAQPQMAITRSARNRRTKTSSGTPKIENIAKGRRPIPNIIMSDWTAAPDKLIQAPPTNNLTNTNDNEHGDRETNSRNEGKAKPKDPFTFLPGPPQADFTKQRFAIKTLWFPERGPNGEKTGQFVSSTVSLICRKETKWIQIV